MKTGINYKLAGVLGLFACAIGNNSVAEPLTYSSDRWPSRWSSVVQQAPVNSRAYGYGNTQRRQPQRRQVQSNPWAHDSSVLFNMPAAQRPWGEPPRKSQRRRTRETYYRDSYYREPNRPMNSMRGFNNAYGYGAGLPAAYTQPNISNPYVMGLGNPAWPYGVSPLLGSPLLTSPMVTSPLLGYPYGVQPLGAGLGRMNWPLSAW